MIKPRKNRWHGYAVLLCTPRGNATGLPILVKDWYTGELLHVSFLGEGLDYYAEFLPYTYSDECLKKDRKKNPAFQELIVGKARLSSSWTYNWLRFHCPEDRELLLPFLTTPYYAHEWIRYWPEDRDLVRPVFTPETISSENACWWAQTYPEHRDEIRLCVTDSKHAYEWVGVFPKDKDLMRHLVVASWWAYSWAYRFPEDRKLMLPRITDPRWATGWAEKYPEDRDLALPVVTEPYDLERWLDIFPQDWLKVRLRPLKAWLRGLWGRITRPVQQLAG